tara:strand:- start:235 stop:429 length:195 start_codon:yes stop_codon:yes gene_type:complete
MYDLVYAEYKALDLDLYGYAALCDQILDMPDSRFEHGQVEAMARIKALEILQAEQFEFEPACCD